VPLSALKPFTYVATWLSNHVTHKPPFFTPVEIEITRKGLKCDASKARRDLGLIVRPIDESLRDAVQWFADNDYIQMKQGDVRVMYWSVGLVRYEPFDFAQGARLRCLSEIVVVERSRSQESCKFAPFKPLK
jgi:hypothetical protein